MRFPTKQWLVILLCCCAAYSARAQFPGPAGTAGSTAVYKDSNIIKSWASDCSIRRGYLDIAQPILGYASLGDSTAAMGKADGKVVSLGDGGIAVLTFASPVKDGPGADFAVFENAFDDRFLELAFVEVSSDGTHFFRFPATSNLQASTQITNADLSGDATKLDNLAGKYRAQYGTPFDLQELAGTPGLDINAVTHIKIIDAVGSITEPYATHDRNSNPVNDPYPTPFPSGGFDLDAVGVMHQQPAGVGAPSAASVFIYPNPVASGGTLHCEGIDAVFMTLQNMAGQAIAASPSGELRLQDAAPGLYFLHIGTRGGSFTRKIMVQ